MASQNTYTTAPDSNYPRRFPFTFPSLDSSEVYVSVAGTLKTVGASNDYTVGNYNKTSGGYIEFVTDTTRGTGTVRVYRLTSGSLKRDFQAGSAIKADDLNTANKQAIYVAEEARQEFVNLAASNTASGFAIDGSNIAPNSITSNKIADLQVKAVDLSSHTSNDTERAVTTNHIRDDAVTTAKIADDAVTTDKLANSINTTIAGKANTGANLSTFTNDTNYITLAQATAGLLTTGMIMMFTGSTAPSGWAFCDGNNGTPDLRNRFIVGAGDTYSSGDTGGAASVTLTISQIPPHTHTWKRQDAQTDAGYRPWAANNNDVKNTQDNTGSTGGGQSHENRPPYYALAYIMKL